MDNISVFLDVCRENSSYWTTGFGISEDFLFTPDHLYHFSLSGFEKVLKTMSEVLRVGRAPSISHSTSMNRLSFTGNSLREAVVEELIRTEQLYVADLEKIAEIVIAPLKREAGVPEKTVAFFDLQRTILEFDSGVLQKIQGSDSQVLGQGLLELVCALIAFLLRLL